MTNIEQIMQEFDDQFYEAPSLYMGTAFGDKDLDQSLKYFIKEALLKVQKDTRETTIRQVTSSVGNMLTDWSSRDSGIGEVGNLIQKWCDKDWLEK